PGKRHRTGQRFAGVRARASFSPAWRAPTAGWVHGLRCRPVAGSLYLLPCRLQVRVVIGYRGSRSVLEAALLTSSVEWLPAPVASTESVKDREVRVTRVCRDDVRGRGAGNRC